MLNFYFYYRYKTNVTTVKNSSVSLQNLSSESIKREDLWTSGTAHNL